VASNFFIYNELFAIGNSIELLLMLHEFIVVMNFAFNMGKTQYMMEDFVQLCNFLLVQGEIDSTCISISKPSSFL